MNCKEPPEEIPLAAFALNRNSDCYFLGGCLRINSFKAFRQIAENESPVTIEYAAYFLASDGAALNPRSSVFFSALFFFASFGIYLFKVINPLLTHLDMIYNPHHLYRKFHFMARLRKLPRSPFWYISFFEYGKTFLVSTKIRHCGQGEPPAGCIVWKFLENTEKRIAESKWGVEENAPTTLNEFANDYLAEMAVCNSPYTFHTTQQIVLEFLEWSRKKGLKHMLDFNPQIVRMWIMDFPDGLARNTLSYKHGVIRTMWTAAQRQYKITENPWKIARIPKTRSLANTLESF